MSLLNEQNSLLFEKTSQPYPSFKQKAFIEKVYITKGVNGLNRRMGIVINGYIHWLDLLFINPSELLPQLKKISLVVFDKGNWGIINNGIAPIDKTATFLTKADDCVFNNHSKEFLQSKINPYNDELIWWTIEDLINHYNFNQ